MKIPVCTPTFVGNEKKYVNDCLDTNWISSSGKYIDKFEEMFAKFCGTKYAVACSNGSTALHLAMASLEVGLGDNVICPNFSIISTSNAIVQVGAIPKFVDSDEKTWCIDPSKIEEKIDDKTKAIMVMHTYGCPCDMDEIMAIAKKYDLKVIEDAAEAHGATYKDKPVGSFGDVACFSFYANKIITTGEGGMVVTNNEKIYKKLKSLRNLGFTEPRFIHFDFGFNYRMTNIQAAIGCAQMEDAENLLNLRIVNAITYNKFLKDVPGITLPPNPEDRKNVYWMYGILIDKKRFGMSASSLMQKLKEKGIETRNFFYSLHDQPIYEAFKTDEKFPVSYKLYEEGLYLPSSSDLKLKELTYVCDSIKEAKNETR